MSRTNPGLLERLEHREYTGAEYSLGRFREVLSRLGDPHRVQRKVIHVAGTNGKGSVATYAARLLVAMGKRTGVYLSPHIHRVNERISIDDRMIPDRVLQAMVAKVRGVRGGTGLTYFEMLTAVMFLWFAERRVDAAVLEVGLGGSLDATNVIPRADVAVITSIGLDHTEILGRTESRIAREKAGIIKPGGVCLCGRLRPAALRVVSERCRCLGVSLRLLGRDFHVVGRHRDWQKRQLVFGYRGAGNLSGLRTDVLYTVQADNAALAIAAVESLGERVPVSAARRALRLVLPSRFEFVPREVADRLCPGIPLILDGSHNPPAIRNLADLLRASPWRRIAVCLTLMREKDEAGVLRELSRLRSRLALLVVYRLGMDRSRPARDLQRAAVCAGIGGDRVRRADDAGAALQTMRAFCREKRFDAVVCTGSQYAADRKSVV
mgnify:CR=1 FL=1